MVTRFQASLASAVLLLTGCAKDINNKEAVRVAVVEYLNQKAQSTGLNVAAMEVQVGSVSFEKDQARAMVSIKPKGGADGMQMAYALVRKGDKWEVKSKQDSGANPHGGGMGAGGAAPQQQPAEDPSLPPGHPPRNSAPATK
jgi:hypothetical protein